MYNMQIYITKSIHSFMKKFTCYLLKSIWFLFKNVYYGWKWIHYPNKIWSHLVTIVTMAAFTPKSISRLWSALTFDSHPMLHSLLLILSVSKILTSISITIITVVFVTLLTTITVCVEAIYCTHWLLVVTLDVSQYLGHYWN